MTRQRLTLRRSAQRGIALPVIMIMLTVMLISSIYLLKSTNSSTLTTANLAYDSALSKAADRGLHAGFAFLKNTPRAALIDDIAAGGYVATVNPADTVNTPAFWNGALVLNDDPAGNRIEYVIHRMCQFRGTFNSTAPVNRCTLTAAKKKVAAATTPGDSLASDSPEYDKSAQLHYVITARIFGARGGNVVNQAVVMMGP